MAKGQRDITLKTKDRATRTPEKYRWLVQVPGRVRSFCSTSDTCPVVIHWFMHFEWKIITMKMYKSNGFSILYEYAKKNLVITVIAVLKYKIKDWLTPSRQ